MGYPIFQWLLCYLWVVASLVFQQSLMWKERRGRGGGNQPRVRLWKPAGNVTHTPQSRSGTEQSPRTAASHTAKPRGVTTARYTAFTLRDGCVRVWVHPWNQWSQEMPTALVREPSLRTTRLIGFL